MCAKLLLFCSLVSACASWSRAEVIREGIYDVESATDMMQSVEITHRCKEENPILGKCGQNIGPYVYLPVTAIIHLLVSAALPSPQREVWQYVTLGIEGSVVSGNAFARY